MITVDTHTGAWVAASRAGFDLILFDFDGLAWHGGGCVFPAACKYAARRYDAERVARAYGDCATRRIRRLQSAAAHSFAFGGSSVCSCQSCVANGHAVIVMHD